MTANNRLKAMFCENLKNEMSQDAVALELNGEMFFI